MNSTKRIDAVPGRDALPTIVRGVGSSHRQALSTVLAGAAFAIVGLVAAATAFADGWVGTWTASPQVPTPLFVAPASEFNNQTIRNIVHVSVGGNAVRLRLTNAFGTHPVTFNAVYVGIQANGASLVKGSNHAVTFGGEMWVTIPVGAKALSDPVSLTVDSEQNLAISLFSAGPTGRPTAHSFAQQTNYVSGSGNFSGEDGGTGFTTSSTSWYFLDGVDVLPSPSIKGAVVTLGDSITDGLMSAVNANQRWPDFLARRFLAGPHGRAMSVLNEAITGNRLLNDSACFGVNAVARVDRDVLTQTGVTHLIVLVGVNDFGFSTAPDVFFSECFLPRTDVSAAQIIAGYQQIIAQAHARGVKVFGGTLTPFKGFFYWTPDVEAKRQAVNDWIKRSRAFDGVIDFAAAVADLNDPTVLAPQYDSGDHAHVNAAGSKALADAIDLSLFW